MKCIGTSDGLKVWARGEFWKNKKGNNRKIYREEYAQREMVRFEKLLWEQVANTKVLGRERTFVTPSKWFNINRSDWYKATQHTVFNTGISGAIFRGLEPIFQKFIYRWKLDIAHQRGLALEDTMLFTDRELRRCYFFETQAR